MRRRRWLSARADSDISDEEKPNPPRSRRVAPRRCRTRAYTKVNKLDKVVLHPERRGCVMLWLFGFGLEYFVISLQDYHNKYAWEGPQILRLVWGTVDGRDDVLDWSWRCEPENDEEHYPGLWPWRQPLPEPHGPLLPRSSASPATVNIWVDYWRGKHQEGESTEF